MDNKDMENTKKDFKNQTENLVKDFMIIFQKQMEKDPRLAMTNMLHLPLNLMLNIVYNSKIDMYKIFPNFPEVYIRFMQPFVTVKERWGKIPNKQFVEEYTKIYEELITDSLPSHKENNKVNHD